MKWTIGKKLIVSFLSIVFLLLLFGLFTLNTIKVIKIKGELYNQLVDQKDLIADILPPPAYIIESYLCAMEIATVEEEPRAREQLLARLKELAEGPGYYRERMEFWEKNLKGDQIRAVFLQDAALHAKKFFGIVSADFSTAVRENRMDKAREIFQRQLKPEYIAHRQAIDKVVEMANANFSQLEQHAAEALQWRHYAMVLFFAVTVVLALVLGLLISRNISRPITEGIRILEGVAQGDMVQRIPARLRNRGDEIGMMADSLHTMTMHLGAMIRDVVLGVKQLSSSSSDLVAVSRQLSSTAQETADKSGMVAVAAEEMNANIQSVSTATEQSSRNVNMVAATIKEVIATINKIARNADNARSISEGAVKQAQTTSGKMASLGDSARNIGKVTETITEISEQTNLLALNATIEAARAGEAGKGFAVVANEIKELARQTAVATVDIKEQIGEMQATTAMTVEDIESISRVITEINQVINVIAKSVEEQSAASSDIADNISKASSGIAEVNESVSQSTVVIAEMTREIAGINQQTNHVKDGSSQVRTSAQGLSELAAQLEQLAGLFKIAEK